MDKLNNLSYLKEQRKALRNESTPAEIALWQMLKGKNTGYKFRRQHSIGNYILDFYCSAVHLAVELDGDVHNSFEAEEYDEKRTQYLYNTEKIRVLRFENKDVFDNPTGVLREITEAIQNVSISPPY